MALLTKDAIKDANRLPHVDVDVPELGEGAQVRIRTMRARDKEAMAVLLGQDKENGPGFMSIVVSRCAVDASGAPLFDSPEAAGEINGVAMQRVFMAALELNRMGRFEEETLKNSEPARAGDSSSV